MSPVQIYTGAKAPQTTPRELALLTSSPLGLSFAKTSSARQGVDLSALIRPLSQLDDPSSAPPASAPPVPLRRPPPARPREPGPASAARCLQAHGDAGARTASLSAS